MAHVGHVSMHLDLRKAIALFVKGALRKVCLVVGYWLILRLRSGPVDAMTSAMTSAPMPQKRWPVVIKIKVLVSVNQLVGS